ncbi:MAG: hypothetical protein RI894_1836 [Bacteroidota bacterium]
MLLKVGLTVLQIASIFTLIPWFFALMMLPMAFDAPNSGSTFFPYGLLAGLLLFPVTVWYSYVYTWLFFHDSRQLLAFLVAIFPLILFFIAIFGVFS